MVKNLLANAGVIRDAGSIPGSEGSREGGYGILFQFSYLENLMDRGSWWVMVHGVARSWTRLKGLSTAQHKSVFNIKFILEYQILLEFCKLNVCPGLYSLEEEVANASSILAWRILWREEPGP